MAKKATEVRVVCFLPDDINRRLQSAASLAGVSKQSLVADIVLDYVEKHIEGISKRTGEKRKESKANVG